MIKLFNWTMITLMTILFVGIWTSNANAQYVPQPGDEIIVKRNGKVIGNMTRAEYKVVKIEEHEPTFTVDQVEQLIVIHRQPVQKNRITLHAGTGYYKMQRSFQNNVHTIEQDRRALLGISYSRKLTNEFSLGATIHTNETATVDAGVDF